MNGSPVGIVERVGRKVRFGLEIFNGGLEDDAENGGIIENVVGTDLAAITNAIQTIACDTNTPLAEAYYTAIRYFQQQDPEAGLNYHTGNAKVIPNGADPPVDDPHYHADVPGMVSCAKNFAILLTDGRSTTDRFVPDNLKDFDNDDIDGGITVDSGTTNDGAPVALPGSDTKKSSFLNYDNRYPAGTTPFTNSYIGNTLFLHDRNDKVIFEGMITGVTYYGGDTSGTSEIALSGTTNTPEYETGASPYNYDLFWRVVTAVATSESEGTAGSDYLDDLSLYARTTDLRDDLEGTQNIVLYTVYAFGGDVAARVLLRDAAKNGGFVDKNDSNTPDLVEEWDRDGDGDPDTFFEASGGFLLEQKLTRAIADILSGTGRD